MIFNSFQFIWLFPLIFLVYYGLLAIVNKKFKHTSALGNYLLIAISYGLYIQWHLQYALILLGVTLITYIFAILIEKKVAYKNIKYLVATGTFLALLPLLVFKYTGFIVDNLQMISGGGKSIEVKLIAPLGISFYTFQAVGYLLDVYNNRIKAERNWWNYMLFVCFFPQILSGPISTGKDLLPQIRSERKFEYLKAVQGLRWLLWGMFLKVVVADRLAIYVNNVLDNYQSNSGVSCLMANIFYTFQIYGDFAGYSLMAIGIARLMGFDLVNNFKRPYFAASITEFWKRWHISLTRWLTTHVYITLGGNRCSKVKRYWNIMATFLVSGIWHGANWTFIVWGVLHGIFQIIEKALGIQKTEGCGKIAKSVRIVITFMLVNFAWLIFRMPTLQDASNCFIHMFTQKGSLYLPQLDETVFIILVLVILILKEGLQEFRSSTYSKLLSNNIIRWSCYTMVFLMIIILGVFNSGSFIYLQF